jgi:hypothetical protein
MTVKRAMPVKVGLSALGLLLLTAGAPAVRAQGFGPDPFLPYNSQYVPYTYPTGPATPDAGGSGPLFQQGIRGANQFQTYLDEVFGMGRAATERYGIGLPYYRSAVSPDFRQDRDYRPNRESAASFEETQQRLTARYLAYFEEKDPKKRAQLLREFQALRRQTSRVLSTRRESASQFVESARRLESKDEVRTKPSDTDMDDESRPGRSTPAPPPPALRDSTTRRKSRLSTPSPYGLDRGGSRSGTRRTPSDVLDRARGLGSRRATDRSSRSSTIDRNN